jgi:hypothetical protein
LFLSIYLTTVEISEKKRGLSNIMKAVVEELIVNHDIHAAKGILIQLTRMKRKGRIETTPDKTQLTYYLAHRRKRLGDRNNICEVIDFITNHLHFDDTHATDLFFFGLKALQSKVVVGNGTDESHFNACFTSVKLLKRLENVGQFHLDCTYKIVKYFFPILVFGITHFDWQFFPIAFMVTSHETDIYKIHDFEKNT